MRERTMKEAFRYATTMRRVMEHKDALESKGHKVIYIALQGSQNYNLDYEESDVDTKAIILPTFKQIALGKTEISFKHTMENKEQIDVKDLRTMINQFKKQNVSYLELLFTEFYWVHDDYRSLIEGELRQRAEEIGKIDNFGLLNSLKGMALQKVSALTKRYEGLKDKIDKYGYDGKQASHLLRLKCFIDLRYLNNKPLAYCYDANHYSELDKETILLLKKNVFELNEVVSACDIWIEEVKATVDGIRKTATPKIDYELIKELDKLIERIYIQHLKEIVTEEYYGN